MTVLLRVERKLIYITCVCRRKNRNGLWDDEARKVLLQHQVSN